MLLQVTGFEGWTAAGSNILNLPPTGIGATILTPIVTVLSAAIDEFEGLNKLVEISPGIEELIVNNFVAFPYN